MSAHARGFSAAQSGKNLRQPPPFGFPYLVFYAFTGTPDGQAPASGVDLVRSALYGTTSGGGTFGFGTIFRDAGVNQETVLYSFTGGADGATPLATPINDNLGNFYGTASAGGASGCVSGTGCGVVYVLDATNTETVLYTFTGGADGANPSSSLARDGAGNLYGVTPYGGDLSCAEGNGFGCGVVFKLDAAGNETILHTFEGAANDDGALPAGQLIRDSAGNLYGVTQMGGLAGLGTVYEIPAGSALTTLHEFAGGDTDGASPASGMVRDRSGNFYGTTMEGGSGGFGTVYKFTLPSAESLVYSFQGPDPNGDGATPAGPLATDSKGNLFGMTQFGGTDNLGAIYFIRTSGSEVVAHSFTGGTDGALPQGGLFMHGTRGFYGATSLGGDTGCNPPLGCGTIIKIDK